MIGFRGGQLLSNGTRNGLGSGFAGVVRYLQEGPRQKVEPLAEVEGDETRHLLDRAHQETSEDPPQRVAWTATRNLPTEDPRHAAFYMREWARENPRVKKPVYHFGAAIAPEESLTRRHWELVADRLLERLGLEDHQAVLALHTDCDHEHIHVVVNRVGPDGRAWKPSFDALKQQDAMRELERELGLRVVPTLRERRLEIARENSLEVNRREIEKAFAQQVAEAALEDFRLASGWADLERRLADRGLRLQPAKRGGGLNVADGRERAALSRVDRSLSGPRLAHRYGETYRVYRARATKRPSLKRSFAPERPLERRDPRKLVPEILEQLSAKRATFSAENLRRLTESHHEGDRLLQLALHSADLVSVGTDRDGAARYTTREYLEAERRLFEAAEELARREAHRLPRERVIRLLDTRHQDLTAEQRAAVLHTTTRQDLAQIVGRAGSGKTHLTRAITAAYEDAGYRVLGAALSGKAAQGLAEEAGINARTLASIERSWGRGHGKLSSRDVLLVDEAGMVDARVLGRVLHHVRTHGAKAILVGDPEQLKAIAAGDAYRGLIEVHGAACVDTIFRQKETWQREASEALAAGKIGEALAAYQANGRLRSLTSADGAREALLAAYFDDRYLHSTDSVLLLAHRRADVRYLNQRIREARLRAGELGAGVRVNGSDFAAGDRILFTRNDHSGRYVQTEERKRGIQNGTFGTITSAEPRRIRVRLDSGREVYFDPTSYDAITHGYACSIHKAQGATADRTYVFATRGFDRNLTYVALTRHRESTLLFYDSETFPAPQNLLAAFSRNPGKDLARDYGELHVRELARNRVFDPEARLEALQQALGQLDRWDRLTSEAQDLAAERERLPQGGSIPDLVAKERRLARERQPLFARLSSIYRHPRTARSALQRSRGDELVQALRENPARFGDLRGRHLLATPTRSRQDALDAARQLADRLADLNARVNRTREALASAQGLRRRAQGLDRELGSLGTDRDEILANIGRIAGPFKIEDLEGQLSTRHLSIVQDLRQAEKAYLSPLKAHLAATNRQEPHTRAAQRLVGRLIRQAPRHILRRLAPAELRLLLTAYRLAHRSLRELDRAMRL